LRSSSMEQGSRPSHGRNSALPPSSSRVPGSWQSQSSSSNPAFAQMQELRKLSNGSIPATAAPRPGTLGRQRPWKKMVVVGGVGLLVLVTTIVVLSNQKDAVEQDPWPLHKAANATQPEPKKEPDPNAPSEPPQDLIHLLQNGTPAERESAAERLKAHADPAAAAKALEDFVVNGDWSERSPRGESRGAALSALLKIDPLLVPHVLKSAATKSDDPRVRAWTYREIAAGKRIDTDNQAVLLPVLLAGLKDANPDNRRLAAEQIRELPAKAGQ